jgi:hypothetical protein
MAKKSTGFNIKEAELAAALEITPQRLDEIVQFFDSDPNDKWELKKDEHFIFINQKYDERIFSELGAYAIAAYIDAKEKKNAWQKLVEFITKHKEKIRNAFISRKIQENCDSLTLRNNRHFLSKKDVVNIFCTSYAKLNKAFEDIKKSSDPMVIYEDFDDIDDVRYYSLSGVYKLSRHLGKTLKREDRRGWCSAVEVVGKKTFKMIIDAKAAHQREIGSAKDKAKSRDKHCCQITLKKPKKGDKFNLAAHHIYSQKEYPHLATSLDNLITLAEEVHKEFHSWNGGFDKPCTADDLIQFVNQLYPDNYEVVQRLNAVKKMFDPGNSQKAA